MSALTRRDFGKAAGALVLSFTLVPPLLRAAPGKLPGSLDKNRMLDAWLRIDADGAASRSNTAEPPFAWHAPRRVRCCSSMRLPASMFRPRA